MRDTCFQIWTLAKTFVLRYRVFLTLTAAISSVSCQKLFQDSAQTHPIYSASERPSFNCSANTFRDTPSVSISGTLRHEYEDTSSRHNNLRQTPSSFVQYSVLSSNGGQLYCDHTRKDGSFSFRVPQSTSSYTLIFYSRSILDTHSFQVFNSPNSRSLYAISHVFSGITDKSNLSVIAKDTFFSTNRHGAAPAFFILQTIIKAHLFLTSETANCTDVHVNCKAYAYKQPLEIFWKEGFNPLKYTREDATYGVSFYIPQTYKLYILGGRDGRSSDTDTDHYDDSIILHEFFHFLQDVYSIQEFPGGSHNGAELIDPRLAFGEGMANFFQAVIRNEANYIDGTKDYDLTEGYHYYLDLERARLSFNGSAFYDCAAQDYRSTNECRTLSGCDHPLFLGEGNFREFAITRYLWDLFDDTPDESSDSIQFNFSKIWAHLTTPHQGLTAVGRLLSSSGNFHDIQSNNFLEPNLSSLRRHETHYQFDEGQSGNFLKEFALPISRQSSCEFVRINPVAESCNENGTTARNLLQNHDYYLIKHKGGSLNVTIEYKMAPLSSEKTHLSLSVFHSNQLITNNIPMQKSTEKTLKFPSEPDRIETTNLSFSASSGQYFLDISPSTWPHTEQMADAIDYKIKVNGQYWCN